MRNRLNVKNILIATHEEGDGSTSSALAYGLSMAKAADGHLMVQAGSVKLDLPSGRTSALVGAMVSAENHRLRDLVSATSGHARADAAMAGVLCDTDETQLTYAELKARAIAQSRVADITVVDADPSALTVDGGLLRALLFEGGRGMVVVPKGFERFDINRAVIAWDGSAAASRAVAAATPFLEAAEEVEVVCFVGEKELPKSAAGADLAAALGRRGVNVVAKELATRGAVAERLREQAMFFGADMIVMGAFVHSPIREWLFGGVTQSMLEATPVPLLMAR